MVLTSFPNGLKVSGYAAPTGATFTIGAESSDVINVGIQMTDGAGNNIATRCAVTLYLSDDANGDTVVAAGQELLIGTDGLLLELVADSVEVLVTEADGSADVDITGTAATAETYYMVLIMPDGRLVVSDAIDFTA